MQAACRRSGLFWMTLSRSCAPRYLHAKIQGLHKELRATHMEINDLKAESVRLRQAIPFDAVVGQASRLGRLSGTQLEAIASIPQSPETLAQIQIERISLAEWERDQLQWQLQLTKRTLTRKRDEHRRALTQSLHHRPVVARHP